MRRCEAVLLAMLMYTAPAYAQSPDAPSVCEDGCKTPDADAELRFAESLFAERDYYRAITEYKRYLFLRPDSKKAPWVRFRIGESYLAGGKLDAARFAFEDILKTEKDPRVRRWAFLAMARAFYKRGMYKQSTGVLEELIPRLQDPGLRGYARYLSGCALLKTGPAGPARSAFEAVGSDHELAQRARWLSQQMVRAEDLPEKSPVLAGMLSIVPGLGHIYLGEYAVAITAFCWNGLFGFATYDGFRRGHYGVGALLAAMELLWYSGTIYGAVSGAHRYNRDARLNFLDELEEGAGLDIPFPKPEAVGTILIQGEF
jgi:outer membrane protein assembly factor BamD (BamD/ComL family)